MEERDYRAMNGLPATPDTDKILKGHRIWLEVLVEKGDVEEKLIRWYSGHQDIRLAIGCKLLNISHNNPLEMFKKDLIDFIVDPSKI